MNITEKLRGHNIECLKGKWVYSDTREPTNINEEYQKRDCGFCGMKDTQEGHDGCLGTLPGLMNACCGHGVVEEAYVQFLDNTSIHGVDAAIIQDILKRHK